MNNSISSRLRNVQKPSISLFTLCFLFLMTGTDLKAQRLSRDLNLDLLVNQIGFVPNTGKTFVTKGLRSGQFEVINVENEKVVFTGNMKPNPGDFGDYSFGDFSTLIQEGHYYIKSDTLRSYPFTISGDVYRSPMDLIVGYFSLQRCGASPAGFVTPCHLDDGIRMDNGKHQDVSGGWHDASDLRKWVSATIYGMVGLGKTYELKDKKDISRPKLLDELKWGNLYFLKMQEPQGYIMNFVGGDAKKHSDSNRWTNNEIGPEGGEVAFVKPNTGRSKQDMLIFGSNDDRVIRTDPSGMVAQYNFITSEALMARVTKGKDNDYSKKCLSAALKCYEWCLKSTRKGDAGSIGAAVEAGIELYKTTKQDLYKDFAIAKAAELKDLQAEKKQGSTGGFYFTSATNKEPFKQISNGCQEFISICDLIQTFPAHKDVPVWKGMISSYANDYLLFISQKNGFGIVPYSLFSKQDPGGNRKTGDYWYRYFMNPELSWWVGINANLASAGIGLMKAGNILNDPKLKTAAQRQLDWIVGVNPFASSTIISVGYNQPKIMAGSEFRPATPLIPGGVMNGLGGDTVDQPRFITENNYQQSEYWTPMVAYTIWLMAEITAAK